MDPKSGLRLRVGTLLRMVAAGLFLLGMLAAGTAHGQDDTAVSNAPTGLGAGPVPGFHHQVEYDAQSQRYTVREYVGNTPVGTPRVMTAEEYQSFRREESMRNAWQQRRREKETGVAGGGLLPVLQVGGENFDRVFGSNTIEIIPQGSAELRFGVTNSRTQNFTIPEDMRSNTAFDFDAKLQVNLTGRVGTKVRLDLKYNTEATFDFEQNVKLEYTGTEDEIIQKIELGNVSLALPGTLITGSQNLFGLRTDLKFGKLYASTIFSQRKGQSQTIEVKGGAQARNFEIRADEYEANRHFFLSQYFYDNYNRALENLPIINSPVEITRVEVWVTNKQGRFDDSRDVVAFVDLAEPEKYIYSKGVITPNMNPLGLPGNEANSLYAMVTSGAFTGMRDMANVTPLLAPLEAKDYRNGRDYEKLENARLLKSNEYTFHPKLGFISLNISLSGDEVLAVAYEFTANGKTYKVGELTSDGVEAPKTLMVKMLKGTDLSPMMPTWRLMMKNIYSLGAYQIAPGDFQLDVLHQNEELGVPVNYIDVGNLHFVPMLTLLNLDNLNTQGNVGADGVFDFVEGVTILSQSGRVILPRIEPFGRDLAEKIPDARIRNTLVYNELYDSTLVRAQQMAEKNKFIIRGEYRASSSQEISLNAPNVPKGSVVVTAGGRRLVENVDYVVDYLLGTVRIINQGLQDSGTPIKVSLESNLGMDLQVRTMMGTHLDYRFSNRFSVGGTVLNLTERPMTKKVNYGNEAMSNTIWGLNLNYETEVPWLTRAIDWLPLLNTKEPSIFRVEAEMAQLVPGQSKHIDKRGSVYLDDFEANKTTIDLRMWNAWCLASVPQGQDDLFPEGALVNDLAYGANRARFAWYSIDPLFLRNSSITPEHIRNNPSMQSSHFVREVEERELFPNRNIPQGVPTTMPILNIAFYPSERGPYNFDATGVQPDGSLQHPENRWGGIMRALPVTDFEQSNIEYIEFWLMDPFVEEHATNAGGDLYFNLGNISEDVLRDGRKSYENGLPTEGSTEAVELTPWGRIPTTRSTVMAFDSNPSSRSLQDVGLDGLDDEGEAEHFAGVISKLQSVLSPEALAAFSQDPSSDNFRYFRSSAYDAQGASILERYKYYNNTQGNSPTAEQSAESYPTSATTIPDAEDVNKDNTLSDNESYYQYRVSLRKNELQVGKNFIADRVVSHVKLADGQESEVAWYQFKIPVKEFARRVGHIQDFKSIRFMRLFTRGFSEPVVLRFATLGLVRGEWRRYERALAEAHEVLGSGGGAATLFDVSAVNIEENSTRTPVNYVLPPNVTREIDATQTVSNELNEQAMELRVVNLDDGDARAAFKNVSYDLRQYRQLSMDVHGEALEGSPLEDGEVTVFLRLGSDYTSNYYEYEVPLRLTSPGFYSNTSDGDREKVWPQANSMEIPLEVLREAKLQRDDAIRESGGRISSRSPYTVPHGEHRVNVLGYPNLGEVRVMMVGIRNPRRSGPNDMGGAKSAVVWLNEMRLSRLVSKGGWAALASMTTKMADFGNLALTGRVETPGFGSLESQVNNRVKELMAEYDINSTLEFGRFFPRTWEVSIPLYVGFSQRYSSPEFNPLDPDVPFKDALRHLPSKQERDSLRGLVLDFSQLKSVNLTNVRVNQRGKRTMLWDPANFSASYSYTERNARNVKTEYRNEITHRGSLAYAYNAPAKSIEPFRRVRFLSSNWLALIRDFNFTPLPRQLSFRTEVQRNYVEQRLRNIHSPKLELDPTYAKNFEWNRTYGLNWDLMNSLKLDISANNLSLIDEPEGIVNRRKAPDLYDIWRDSVRKSLRTLGRPTRYNHRISLAYTVPFSKMPLLSWLSGMASYTTDYQWEAAPRLKKDVAMNLGNKIQNARTIQLQAQANITSLYHKVGYLRDVDQKFDRLARGEPMNSEPEYETVEFRKENFSLAAGKQRNVTHGLATEQVKVVIRDASGAEIPVTVEVRDANRVRIKTDGAIRKGTLVVEGQRLKPPFGWKVVGEGILRTLMGLRNVSATWSENAGSFMPGYLPQSRIFGCEGFMANAAPGFPFVIGFQDPHFPWRAIDNGWLTADPAQNELFRMNRTRTFNYRISLEPFPSFRIEITGMRTHSVENSRYYQYTGSAFEEVPQSVRGSFNISTILIGTAFSKTSMKNGYTNPVFEQFSRNRLAIAKRLAQQRAQAGSYNADAVGSDGIFPDGYSATSQEVLLPAFVAAYTGRDPERVGLELFPLIPLPNWQVTYDGLSRLNAVKGWLRQLSIRHGYRANFVIGGFEGNRDYLPGEDGLSYVRNVQNDFLSQYSVANVSMTEQFSPLAGLDIGFVLPLTAKAEVRKTRNLSMSFANNQLTDMDTWEYVVGAGYRFEDLPLIMKNQLGGRKVLKSELRLQADFSIRQTSTILRRLNEGTNIPSAGLWGYTLKISADYMISEQITLRAYFDRIVNRPLVSLSFPTANTSFGFSLRFTMDQ